MSEHLADAGFQIFATRHCGEWRDKKERTQICVRPDRLAGGSYGTENRLSHTSRWGPLNDRTDRDRALYECGVDGRLVEIRPRINISRFASRGFVQASQRRGGS
jgi:hypothetical protein